MDDWITTFEIPPEYQHLSSLLTPQRLSALMEIWAAKIDQLAAASYEEAMRMLADNPRRQEILRQVLDRLPPESSAGKFWIWLAKQFQLPFFPVEQTPLANHIDAAPTIADAIKETRLRHQPMIPFFDMDIMQVLDWATNTNYDLTRQQRVNAFQQRDPLWHSQDGWTVENVHPEDAQNEGRLMKNCMGTKAQWIASGNESALSLKDPEGYPHASMIYRHGENIGDPRMPIPRYDLNGRKQFSARPIETQGVANNPVKPEHQQYLDSFHQWAAQNPQQLQQGMQRTLRDNPEEF